MLTKTKGSNQHQPKYQFGSSNKFIIAVFILMAGLSAGLEFANSSTSFTLHASEVEMLPKPTTTLSKDSDGQVKREEGELDTPSEVVGEMEQIIIDTFGEHSDKAFQLLECENRSLNPNATNDNTKWGGTGVDRGLFQINDYWQGIRHEGKAQQLLYDPHINARIAWRLYEDSGYSFKMWTCGRNLGI